MPTILINDKTCFYQDVGEGQPLLLGHSYLWTSHMWEPQLKSLAAKGYRCIAPDLWSHGKSARLNEKNITIQQLADNAWSLMEKLGIPEFAVVGLSIGGMWGTELAFKYPHAVKALVLMNTYVGSEPEVTKQKYFALMDRLEQEKRFTAPLLNQIVPLFFSPSTLLRKPKIVENFKNSLSAIKEENIPGIVTIGRSIFSRSCSLDKLSKLIQPAMILVGKEDVPRPPKESQEMASRFQNAEMHIIENAGHISSLEQPEQVNSILINFLNKI